MTTQRKIDNSLLKRFERKENSNSRKVNSKEKRVYFLIVCEGEETEPNYFKAFERELPPYTLNIQPWGTARDPLGVVNAAIEFKKRSKKDSVWVVFDKDDFPAKNFNAAIKKAAANQIKCAWSNEAFELWYILHFQYLDTPLSRNDYQRLLETEINKKANKGKTPFKYNKNSKEMFQLLKKYGNQEQAIQRAIKLEQQFENQQYATHNPCTLVYKLVEELNNPQIVFEK
ncbi:RloB family protein [Macellibacteroides fermentans]|uniref:RloB family protein n=1 Tax=Macellibacteroides fermentans TaxID=879969 RepID=UPI003B936968